MEKRDEPINPCTIKGRQGFADMPSISTRDVYGLTKREYFAGLAMQGLLANPNTGRIEKGRRVINQEEVANNSLLFADQLLKTLENIK